VASTGKAVSGGITGGYDTADALCETARAAAGSTDSVGSWKVCSAEEVLNSYKCTAAGDSSYIRQTAADGPAWINAGPPGYVAWSNDCNAWQNDAPTGSSPNIITSFGRVWLTVCTANLRYACCK
jgi:hypothetical protein